MDLLVNVDVGSDVGGTDVEAGCELRYAVDLVEHRGHGGVQGQLDAFKRERVAAGLERECGAGGESEIEDVVTTPDRIVDDHHGGKHGRFGGGADDEGLKADLGGVGLSVEDEGTGVEETARAGIEIDDPGDDREGCGGAGEHGWMVISNLDSEAC